MLQSELTRVETAYAKVRDLLLDQRTDAGHWIGRLSASALSTATAISALSFWLNETAAGIVDRKRVEHQILAGISWLIRGQNRDGGWGDTNLSYSNISTTMLVIAALHAAGRANQFADEVSRAQMYVNSNNGIQGIRDRYGKDKTFAVPILASCAMSGIVPWKEVAALPFEAACVPQRLYCLMQMPVVSYAIPALVAIGLVKFGKDPPWNPITRVIRRMSTERSLNVLKKMQPASGGFLEAVPLTSFVCMGLIHDRRADHEVVHKGIRFIADSFRTDTDDDKLGAWPIDTNLATWTTTLSINALLESGEFNQFWRSDQWEPCINWLLKCQYKDVHPFTGAAPGGWGWSDLSGAVPDADDTPGAMLALKNVYDQFELTESRRAKILDAAISGSDWLLGLQNRDHGWPTFCRGWGKLPFDRSGTDITAHVIRALYTWQSEFSENAVFSRRIRRSIESGFKYIERNQMADGSWLPLWFGNQDEQDDVNPYYGTAKVLMAFRDTGRFDTQTARDGLNWLLRRQNADGGWGGGVAVRWNEPTLGNSSVEETALCTEAIVSFAQNDSDVQEAARRGMDWLTTAIETDNVRTSCPIGFYFAKLWYYERLYPMIFTTSALGRALRSASGTNDYGGEDV